jgi:site-specific recombinase XerD
MKPAVEAPSLQLPAIVTPSLPAPSGAPPAIIVGAGPNARFAWEEFFDGEIANSHTRKNYEHAVRKFLAWVEAKDVNLIDVTPGLIGQYFRGLDVAVPTKKLHLSALRRFFDRLVNRHAAYINPAATVRAERYSMVEGKTPEIQKQQAETLIKSIRFSNPADSDEGCDLVGLRDRAILAVLAFTAARVGAVAGLSFKSLRHDGTEDLKDAMRAGRGRYVT